MTRVGARRRRAKFKCEPVGGITVLLQPQSDKNRVNGGPQVRQLLVIFGIWFGRPSVRRVFVVPARLSFRRGALSVPLCGFPRSFPPVVSPGSAFGASWGTRSALLLSPKSAHLCIDLLCPVTLGFWHAETIEEI